MLALRVTNTGPAPVPYLFTQFRPDGTVKSITERELQPGESGFLSKLALRPGIEGGGRQMLIGDGHYPKPDGGTVMIAIESRHQSRLTITLVEAPPERPAPNPESPNPES